MSNRDRDARYEDLKQAVRFALEQWEKGLHVGLPAVVVGYDAATARARVQPAVDLLFTDGGSAPKPIIFDVPVLMPAGGGMVAHVPMAAGDPVMLLFSERDIDAFKATLRRGPPASDRIMALVDAVAVGGFVPLTFAPRPGLTMQTADGETFISVQAGNITIKADSITLRHSGGEETYP